MWRRLSEENRVLNGRETFPKTVQSSFDWTEILPIVPIPVFLILFLVLAVLDIRTVFEPSWGLPTANVLFLLIIPFAVVYIATQGYVRSGFITLLMLGAGTLSFGLGALLAGLVLSLGGPNANVTVYNFSALSSATFHVLGAALAFIGLDPQKNTRHKKLIVTLTYLIIAILLTLMTIATVKGLTPVFFVQGEGPTVWRQTVLATAMVLFVMSGLLFAGLYLFSRVKVLYWYSLALFLIATGLICVLFQKSVGSPVGWLGRGAQYLWGIYLLVAVVSAWKDLHRKGLTMQEGIADLFRHRLAMLVEERTSQLRRANEQLSNEVTERKKAEDALRKSEERLELALSGGGIGWWDRSIQTGEVILSQRWTDLLGYPLDARGATVSTWADLIHPDDAPEVMKVMNGHLEGNTPMYEAEYRLRAKSGEWKWILDRAKVVDRAKDGKPLRIVGTYLDITERKLAEVELQKLGLVVQNSSEFVALSDLDGRLIFINEAGARTVGISPEKVGEHVVQDIVSESYQDLVKTEVIPEILERGCWDGLLQLRHIETGKLTDVQAMTFLIRDPSTQQPLYLANVALDVTQQRRLEEALRESEQLYRTLFERARDCIMLIGLEGDHAGQIVAANPVAAEMHGYVREELLSLKISDLDTPESAERVPERIERILAGEWLREETSHRRKDGSVFPIEISASLVEIGEIKYALAIDRDISARKQAEEALIESEARVRMKLDSIISPGGDIGALELADVIDAGEIQTIMDDFYGLTNIGVAILDLKGKVLVATGWQDICTKFHRVHPETSRNCIASDTQLSSGIDEGAFRLYRCMNNMWDIATPIIVGGKHLGNLFLGQFLFEEESPDHEIFRAKARQYGFDEQEYLAALDRIPRWSRETVDRVMRFYAKMTRILSRLSFSNILLSRSIADRKRAEDALRDSELMLRTMLSTSPVGIGLAIDGRIKWGNEAIVKMFGFDSEHDWFDQPIEILYPSEEVYKESRSRVYATVQAGEVGDVDTVMKRKDGSLFDASLRICQSDQSDPSKGTISVISDISSRKRAEEALRESEERFRSVFEQGPLGIAIVSLDYRWVSVNAALCEMVGYTEDELTNLTFVDITHPDDLDANLGYAEKLVRGEIPSFMIEKRYIRKNGRVIWINLTVSIVRDDEGKSLYYLSMIEDITGRKKAEDAVRQSEHTLRSLVDGNPESLLMTDTEGIILVANEEVARRFATTVSELIGSSVYDLLPPDVAEDQKEHVQEVIRTGKPVRFEDSRFGRTIDNHIQPIVDDRGQVVSLAILGIDITNLRKAEEVQRRLATAIEQSAEAVIITDAEAVIQYVNPATEQITGFKRSEMIGNNPRIFKSGEHDRAFYEQLWNTIRAGNVWSGRIINKKKDGTLYPEDATISPVRDASGKIVNFVAVKRDITEQLQLSRQLQQAQKMEAIGTLAGGIAHDFNNLLTVVLGFSELLLIDRDERNPAYADLQKINQAARNGADLVKRILMFSRKADINLRPMNLNHEIEQSKKLLSRTIPKMVEIELVLSDELGTLNADPTQVEQILMNLAVNAKDAMPDGGTLTIETTNVTLDKQYCTLHLGAKPGDYVLLSVSDTGHGIDKETLNHIFEPFFTTKEAGKGTGLGLAMVYGIVKQHDGYITCDSEPGMGTTFKIYFPVMATEAKSKTPTAKSILSRGTETILLADDEEFVRDLGKRILERSGYAVFTATNGKEALALYKKERDKISLVILDLIMPEMGGKECFQKLLEISPQVKVLIASGYTSRGTLKDANELGARGFVSKPFNIAYLLQSVREVLDAD